MIVLDNFFPKSTIDLVIDKSKDYEWQFCRTDKFEDTYWTIFVYGDTYEVNNDKIIVKNFKYQEVKNCWEAVKEKFNFKLTDNNLDSCYLNGLTHGLESHAHIDSGGKVNFVTVVCYICEFWNSHWSGETCFYNMDYSDNPSDDIYYNHEIIRSVLPKYNRVVLFDGNVVHSVKPISKTFKGLRKTLMFKLKNINIKDLS